MRTLLFSWDFELLGEFYFEAGKLDHFSLSHGGEQRLGAQVRTWQTLGIALIERGLERGDAKGTTCITSRQILLSNPDAEAAFFCWAAEEGYPVIHVPDRLFPAWQKLCSLPLEPEERFAALNALRSAPHALFSAWEKAIDLSYAGR